MNWSFKQPFSEVPCMMWQWHVFLTVRHTHCPRWLIGGCRSRGGGGGGLSLPWYYSGTVKATYGSLNALSLMSCQLSPSWSYSLFSGDKNTLSKCARTEVLKQWAPQVFTLWLWSVHYHSWNEWAVPVQDLTSVVIIATQVETKGFKLRAEAEHV